jgi:hypothetical protein
MIIEKLQMPYILASQHALIHMSCMISSLLMHYFFSLDNKVDTSRDWDMNNPISFAYVIILSTHAFCTICHVLIKYFRVFSFDRENASKYLFITQFLILMKFLVYFVSIIYV